MQLCYISKICSITIMYIHILLGQVHGAAPKLDFATFRDENRLQREWRVVDDVLEKRYFDHLLVCHYQRRKDVIELLLTELHVPRLPVG